MVFESGVICQTKIYNGFWVQRFSVQGLVVLKDCIVTLFKQVIMNPVTNSDYQPRCKGLILGLCTQNIYEC